MRASFGDRRSLIESATAVHLIVRNPPAWALGAHERMRPTLADDERSRPCVSDVIKRFRGPATLTSAVLVAVACVLQSSLAPAGSSLTRAAGSRTAQRAGPDALALSGWHLWVAYESSNSLVERNAGTGGDIRTVKGSSYHLDYPSALALSGTNLWVANFRGDSLTEVNATTGALVRTVSGARYSFVGPRALLVTGAHLWVADKGGATLTELNATTGALVRVVKRWGPTRMAIPVALAHYGPYLWVADYGFGTLDELTATTGALVRVLKASKYDL